MSSEPDVQPAGQQVDADTEGPVEPSKPWARARNSLRVPRAVVRLARRDPHHIPERLTIYSVDRQADRAREWAQRAREAAPESSPAVLADAQRRRTISTARIDGAVAGTPFFIALVPRTSPSCARRCGFICVWRRSTATTRPTPASPPTSSCCAGCTRTRSRHRPHSNSSAPPRSPPRAPEPR